MGDPCRSRSTSRADDEHGYDHANRCDNAKKYQNCVLYGAISPTEVYLLGMKAFGYDLDPIAKIHRDKLGVDVHQRMTVRTVVLEDLETGHKFPLEAARLSVYHAKAMVQLLMMSEEHHEEEIEEEDPAGFQS